jgi:hypothetical protein
MFKNSAIKSALIPLLVAVAVGVVAQEPDRIQQHVKHLASEALEGRRTGSNGATEAARYIAEEFKRCGRKWIGVAVLAAGAVLAGVTVPAQISLRGGCGAGREEWLVGEDE